MVLHVVEPKLSAAVPKPLPQFVPSSVCFRCDVCCRFPEADSFLRPYFTGREIAAAVAHGVVAESFPDPSGSRINLTKNPTGEGYLCPAFDATTGRCGIYESRPLDCQLYPLALMWDQACEEVVLGWDAKCPFMREAVPATIAAHAEQVAMLFTTEAMIETVADNPRLIGRFQDDVVVLRSLPKLTDRLLQPRVDHGLHPLTVSDAPRFKEALKEAEVLGTDVPAAYAFPYHYIWTSLLPHWWMASREVFFLFAQSPDGWFMPLPPLGPKPLDESVGEAFTMMQRWNGHSPVSRIENVMGQQKQLLERGGFSCRQKDGDYLYRANALAVLAGDHYKSQRALCNRIEREQVLMTEPYRGVEHQCACLELYERWAAQKQVEPHDSLGMLLLQDAKAAHRLVFVEHGEIGLSGTVAIVQDRIVAYTFGYWLTPHTWCVLLEVADRALPGLAQWLFRETCRTADRRGAAYINTMDDAGLPGLRAAKQTYHPLAVLGNWVITDSQR